SACSRVPLHTNRIGQRRTAFLPAARPQGFLPQIFMKPIVILLLLCLAVSWVSPAGAETLYVSPNGNDAWTGALPQPTAARTDGPLASLAGARDAVRKRKAQGEPTRVLFATGTYRLTEPVVFGPEDSGTAQAPISYEAAPEAKPVFSGGQEIGG